MRRLASILCVAALAMACQGPTLEPWHTVKLKREFKARDADEIRDLAGYLSREAELFVELDEKVYGRTETGPAQLIERFSTGSLSDPTGHAPNWNRTFELLPDGSAKGGVLLLHGMSDSPYSLRAIALTLRDAGHRVLGLRLPGHGTAPSGLRHVSPDDMRAAVRLAMRHLSGELGDAPIHVIGYSTGATLALDHAIEATTGSGAAMPSSLVLISPAIRIHRAAGLARFKNALSWVPGLDGMAWLSVLPEFDPYKYNSFATNAGAAVHALTRGVDTRIGNLSSEAGHRLPPILAIKSTADSTVTTEAIVDGLFARLEPDGHELVLFDVNRMEAKSRLLVENPGPLTDRLVAQTDLPFAVTIVGNAHPDTDDVIARTKAPFTSDARMTFDLGEGWPAGVLSLSHIAMPFPPNDPLYGRQATRVKGRIFLGDMALRGEIGLLALSPEWLLRMRYNPFWSYAEMRIVDWLERPGAASPGAAEPGAVAPETL